MLKRLAGLALAAGIMFGVGAEASAAAYPPAGAPAEISFGTPKCAYSDKPEVVSWGVDVTLNVKAADAKMSILGPGGTVFRAPSAVATGSRTFTIGSNESGFDVAAGAKEITVRVEANGVSASKSITPCPIGVAGPTTTSTTDPKTNAVSLEQSGCVVDATSTNGIKDWYFTVNYRVATADTGQLLIDDQRGTTYLDRTVNGTGTLRIDSSVGPFGNAQAPYLDFRVTLLVNNVVYQADVTPCPIASSNSTTTTSPQVSSKLPATGARLGTIVAGAGSMLLAGIALLWATRERRQVG